MSIASHMQFPDLERNVWLVSKSIQAAERCMQQKNYGRAFAHYLLVCRLQPAKKHDIKETFSTAFREWSDELERKCRWEDLFKCFDQACQFFPECEQMLNNMGSQLFRLGYVDEAASCFRKALRQDPSYLGARENLENVCSHLVERWHFRMLNDTLRNQSFKSAIETAVKQGYTSVLDIGTGTGLLSMFAAKAGAQEVYSCEMSKTMYELAGDVLVANQMKDKVHLIHAKSTDITVPDDIPKRVPLIVTETVDAGLLGEGMLSTLDHAWEHLLLSDKTQARVIPSGATVVACLVECEAIRKQNRLLYPGLCQLDLTQVSLVCKTSVPHRQQRDGTAVEDDDDDDEEDEEEEEPYTTENLKYVRGGYRAISDTTCVFQFDFNDPQAIRKYRKGISRDLQLPVIATGRLDAIAMWFVLELDPDTHLSTSPSSDRCWEQAIFPVLPEHIHSHGCERRENLVVREGEMVHVHCSVANDLIHLYCTDIKREIPGTQKNQPQGACTSSSQSSLSFGDVFRPVPSYSFCGFEDNSVSQGAYQFVENSEDSLRDCDENSHSLRVRDLSQGEKLNSTVDAGTQGCSSISSYGASINTDKTISTSTSKCDTYSFGGCPSPKSTLLLERHELGRLNDIEVNTAYFSAVQKLQQEKTGLSILDITQGFSALCLQSLLQGAAQVTLTGQDETNQMILRHISEANQIDAGKLLFVNGLPEEGDQGYDVLVTELVEPCGALRQQVLEDIALAKVSHLRPGGGVVPQRTSVYGMCIHSEKLKEYSMVVSDQSTLGWNIAQFINDFKMRTHVDVDLQTLPYTRLTEPFKIFDFDFNLPHSSDMLNFLEKDVTVRVPACENGSLTGVVYWFDIYVADAVRLCTLDEPRHWRQAVVMMAEDLDVTLGDGLCIQARCRNSCIDITVK
ncbi:protein arginine N-methyltransferase 9 isoform X1 [Lingula anatina]|uniref:Protein arginine N-methyltransferase 9 isoform X1 n=2 Tax=Lingula anatina TaxID=7574 RepID=A0A1S3I4I2_LINAN|nr:protein arginine N-methyltransferase 9 isoform X1 [Lingula anatina]|eukprot:XP_013393172.1 protein arginine N-methyltransferase 9 isoform X1 [Lingula anatina]